MNTFCLNDLEIWDVVHYVNIKSNLVSLIHNFVVKREKWVFFGMPKSCLIRNVLECFIFYWIFLPFLTIFHMLYKMKYEIWSEISAACYWLNSEHSHKRFTILDLSQLIWTFLYINVCIIISVAWPQGITLEKVNWKCTAWLCSDCWAMLVFPFGHTGPMHIGHDISWPLSPQGNGHFD